MTADGALWERLTPALNFVEEESVDAEAREASSSVEADSSVLVSSRVPWRSESTSALPEEFWVSEGPPLLPPPKRLWFGCEEDVEIQRRVLPSGRVLRETLSGWIQILEPVSSLSLGNGIIIIISMSFKRTSHRRLLVFGALLFGCEDRRQSVDCQLRPNE